MPPDRPAAKLRPVLPSTTTVPPVMYSQQWSPAPSTTATAPELRTANRSPTEPATKTSPPVPPAHPPPPRTGHEHPAPRGPVQARVAGQHGIAGVVRRRGDDDPPAAHRLP